MKKVSLVLSLVLLILTLIFALSKLSKSVSNNNYQPSKIMLNHFKQLPYEKVKVLGAIGSDGHSSNDLKSDIRELALVRDNYGSDTAEKFGNYVEDYVKFANDLFEVNHLTHYADYYSALWQGYKSENFPYAFVVRNTTQSDGREKFTAVGVTAEGVICLRSFDFFIPGDIDEGEDFYTNNSVFDHVTFYSTKCNLPGPLERYLSIE